MRTGKVAALNTSRGIAAIATEDGGYTIIELQSHWELASGDVIAWDNDYGLGSEIYKNVTKRTHAQVFVQNHDVSQSSLRAQLRLPS